VANTPDNGHMGLAARGRGEGGNDVLTDFLDDRRELAAMLDEDGMDLPAFTID